MRDHTAQRRHILRLTQPSTKGEMTAYRFESQGSPRNERTIYCMADTRPTGCLSSARHRWMPTKTEAASSAQWLRPWHDVTKVLLRTFHPKARAEVSKPLVYADSLTNCHKGFQSWTKRRTEKTQFLAIYVSSRRYTVFISIDIRRHIVWGVENHTAARGLLIFCRWQATVILNSLSCLSDVDADRYAIFNLLSFNSKQLKRSDPSKNATVRSHGNKPNSSI